MLIGLAHYMTAAAILFTLGVFGIFLNRKNIMLMSIELMLLAVSINFVAFGLFEQPHRPGLCYVRADRSGSGSGSGDRPSPSSSYISAITARSGSRTST